MLFPLLLAIAARGGAPVYHASRRRAFVGQQLSEGSASDARGWVWRHWRRLSCDRRRQIKSVAVNAAWLWAITSIAVVILDAVGFTAPSWVFLVTVVPAVVLLMAGIFVLIPLALVHMWWTSDARKSFWRRRKAQNSR